MTSPMKCPKCKSNLDNGDIYEFFLNKYGKERADSDAPFYGWTKENPKHFSRAIAIYDLNSDTTTHWRCPDCKHEWKAKGNGEEGGVFRSSPLAIKGKVNG